MIDVLLRIVLTAAWLGLRSQSTASSKGAMIDYGDLLSLYESLGYPPMPSTAPWLT